MIIEITNEMIEMAIDEFFNTSNQEITDKSMIRRWVVNRLEVLAYEEYVYATGTRFDVFMRIVESKLDLIEQMISQELLNRAVKGE